MNDPQNPDTTPVSPDSDYALNATETNAREGRNAAKKIAKSESGDDADWARATLQKLAFANLEEQRRARRWRTFVRMSWLIFFIGLVWLGIDRSGASQDVSTPHTAVVEIKGEKPRMPTPALK